MSWGGARGWRLRRLAGYDDLDVVGFEHRNILFARSGIGNHDVDVVESANDEAG